MSQNREIGAMHDRPQESVGCAPAPAALLVHLEVGAAEVVAAVEGLDRGDAACGGGFAPGVDDVPAYPRVLHPHLAAGAVTVGCAPFVIFKGLEYRENFIPGPPAIAEGGPVVPVLPLAAHVDRGVDRRAAAEHAAARVMDRAPGEMLVGLGLVAPVGARIGDGVEVAHRDADPEIIVLAAGFEQQDAGLRIAGQAVGGAAAGAAGGRDDLVGAAESFLRKVHGAPLAGL